MILPPFPSLAPSYAPPSSPQQLEYLDASVPHPLEDHASDRLSQLPSSLPNALGNALVFVMGLHAGQELPGTVREHSELWSSDPDLATVYRFLENGPTGGITELGEMQGPLRLVAWREEETMHLRLAYDAAVLRSVEAGWFLSHLLMALPSFLASTSASHDPLLSDINLVSESEQQELDRLGTSLGAGEQWVEPFPGCEVLYDVVLATARRLPHAQAIQFDEMEISYSQLVHLGMHLAHRLLPLLPIGGGEVVIPLSVDKSVEMVVSMLAVSLVGGAYLALEPKLPEKRKEGIVRSLNEEGLARGVAVVQSSEVEIWHAWVEGEERVVPHLVDPTEVLLPLLDALRSSSTPLSIDLDALFPLPSEKLLPRPSPSHAAYLIFTSGSSGVPKGITVEHRNVVAFLKNYHGVFGRAEGERVLQFPSYAFDVSVMNIWDTFAHGATLCVTPTHSLLSDLPAAVLRLGCTLVDLTPTISTLLFEHPAAVPSAGETVKQAWLRAGFKIKVLSTGGEKVERWVRDAWLERGVKVVIDYGPSETTVGVISSRTLPSSPRSTIVPIGRPTGRNRVHLFHADSLVPVPLGCIGEICISGDQVARGYLKTSLNEGVFIAHERFGRMYRTGDLGRFLGDDSRSIDCLGRRDGQVKINGLRIEVGEIEQHLNSSVEPFLSRGVVDKLDLPSLPLGLVAYLELVPSCPLLPPTSFEGGTSILAVTRTIEFQNLTQDLSRKLAEVLPSYMIPRYWLCVNRIPTAGMGKTDRKLLLSLASSHTFRSLPSTISQYPGAEYDRVRQAWSSVLRMPSEEIGDEQEFTKLGGDSIGWIRVVRLLGGSFGKFVEVGTVKGCVDLLRNISNSHGAARTEYVRFSLITDGALGELYDEIAEQHAHSSIVDVLPTSPTQDTLLAPSIGSTHYYAQAVYPVHVGISSEVLRLALGELVKRNEVLRTVFWINDKGLWQVVLGAESEAVRAGIEVEMKEYDDDQGLEKGVTSWLEHDRSAHCFAWGRLLLSFAILSSRKSGTRKLIWCMHHAMSDGFTLELLTTDLRALCHDLHLSSRPSFNSVVTFWSTLPPTPIETREFWKSYLASAQPLAWPSIAPLHGAPLETTRLATRHWTGDLSSFARTEGITPAVLSRVAVEIALGHHARTQDVLIGIVRSGRDVDIDRCDEIIGPLVSVLPSRLVLDPATSLLDLLHHESRMDKLSRAHQQMPLPVLSTLLSLSSCSALFNILLTYQSLAEFSVLEEELAIWPVRQPPERIAMPTGYTLSVEITPVKGEDGTLELGCFYDPRVLETTGVERFLGTVHRVLDIILDRPSSTLASLALDLPSAHIEAVGSCAAAGVQAERRGDIDQALLRSLLPRIAKVWSVVLRLDDPFATTETFNALGGDSIAVMRLSVRMKKEGLAIPMHELLRLGTVQAQATWLARKSDQI